MALFRVLTAPNDCLRYCVLLKEHYFDNRDVLYNRYVFCQYCVYRCDVQYGVRIGALVKFNDFFDQRRRCNINDLVVALL